MNNIDKKFAIILNKMVDAQLTEAENRQLEEYLTQSKESMQFYLDFCHLQSSMEGKGGKLSTDLRTRISNI